MKLLTKLFIILFLSNNVFAKSMQNKRSFCVGDLLKIYPKYVYQYPKDIDKMTAENPEFKDDILSDTIFLDDNTSYRKENENLFIAISKSIELHCTCEHFKCNKLKSLDEVMKFFATECELGKNIGSGQFVFYINSCKKLWLYGDKVKNIDSLDQLILLCNLEYECNKIVKKILKKTGKLY